MRELGIPIDFAGGASMGAVVAGCVAMGWDDAEIDYRIRKGFVESNPLGDWNIPVVGMVKGHRVDARLKEHFGEAEIGDLELPFFAVSTNLTDGAYRVHRQGLLRRALRASIALPGILPPVIEQGEVLGDGSVLNYFPTDVMRELQRAANVVAAEYEAEYGRNPIVRVVAEAGGNNSGQGEHVQPPDGERSDHKCVGECEPQCRTRTCRCIGPACP